MVLDLMMVPEVVAVAATAALDNIDRNTMRRGEKEGDFLMYLRDVMKEVVGVFALYDPIGVYSMQIRP